LRLCAFCFASSCSRSFLSSSSAFVSFLGTGGFTAGPEEDCTPAAKAPAGGGAPDLLGDGVGGTADLLAAGCGTAAGDGGGTADLLATGKGGAAWVTAAGLLDTGGETLATGGETPMRLKAAEALSAGVAWAVAAGIGW
jgi:hypothetical protein